MANDIANNAKKQKFIDLLHELFQLNQPELDFGLYRIMHAKSGQIKAFIENDLAREIDGAFAAGGDDKVAELKAAYEQARAQAKEFGIDDPDANPKVKEAKEAYDAAREGGDDPSDIYDHLYRFFSRYYDKGDFLSRRYHVAENDSRAAPFAVPYDGREVYLHWANKDQYYIKSSEYLSNFSFDLAEAMKKERQRQGAAGQAGFDFEAENGQPLKVTFQLVEAAEGAHNNVKENQSRFFIIHSDNPVEVLPLPQGEGRGEGDAQGSANVAGGRTPGATELIINFEYRPDPEKSGQEGTWQKKRLEEAENVVLDALKNFPHLPQGEGPGEREVNQNSSSMAKAYYEALAYLAPTEKQKDRTLLNKYLASYTARNTMDYFIHKDLGGFLRREMDFYIKNEIMRLDDLSAEDITGVTRSLKKITALRAIARQIIDFLAQLEEFQKKLWLKKKFVTEVNYCITLDRVPEEFYDEITVNERQWAQWEELGFITKDTDRTKGNLDANPYMMVDTGLCEDGLKARLLAEIEGLDEQCDGVLVHSDNFQSLGLVGRKYSNSLDAIYIDPPYNTDAGPISYKNGYRSSSWVTLIADRLKLSKEMMKSSGVLCATIDDYQQNELHLLLEEEFGKDNHAGTVSVRINPSGRPVPSGFAQSHEYAIFMTKSEDGVISKLPRSEQQMARYRHIDDDGAYMWELFRKRGSSSERADRPSLYYPLFCNGESIRVPKMSWDDSKKIWNLEDKPADNEVVAYPIDEQGVERRWRGKPDDVRNNPDNYKAKIDGEIVTIYYKFRPKSEGVLPLTLWFDAKYSATEHGTGVLKQYFKDYSVFSYPKSIYAVEDCLTVCGLNSPSGKVCDYFAGSGTTGHAVINLNRKDGGNRKYVLVEMGDYFDTVLKPRIQKVVYANTWREGNPQLDDDGGFGGVSHTFKYLRLESYEDTLNNLMLDSDERRADMLAQEDNARLRKDYLLHYFLDVETRGSASLLNVEQFRDPSVYTLMVKKPGSDSQVPVKVDLAETFNWLIGLEVALLDRPRTYTAEFEREKDPELPEDQHTRLKVTRFKEISPSPQPSPARGEGAGEGFWFRIVEGYVRRTPGSDADKEKVMVVWRKLTDEPEQDAAALEALLEKYRVNQADSEFDKIYINGPHGLTLSGQAKARLLSLEETFMARMWEGV